MKLHRNDFGRWKKAMSETAEILGRPKVAAVPMIFRILWRHARGEKKMGDTRVTRPTKDFAGFIPRQPVKRVDPDEEGMAGEGVDGQAPRVPLKKAHLRVPRRGPGHGRSGDVAGFHIVGER